MRCGGPGLCSECTADASRARSALAQPSPTPVCTTPTGENCPGDGVKSCKKCPEQAEAERPEVVAYFDRNYPSTGDAFIWSNYEGSPYEPLMTVSQHERIVGELRADRDSWAEQAEQRLADWDEMRKERDAALARVAELELKLDKSDYAYDNDRIHMRDLAARAIARAKVFDDGSDGADAESARSVVAILRELLAVGPAQAQHSAGYAEARQCVNCRHIGINDAADYAACHDCRWTGPEPDEDKCPGCAGENCIAAACPECGGRYELVAEANIATPVAQAQHSVPEGFREKFEQCMELAFAEITMHVSPDKCRDPESRPRKASRLATELRAMLAAAPAQAQHSVPDGASDLCRFLAKLYCELDGLRYSTAKLPAEQIADALIFKWPVLQGARNQLNIKRISEQPYDESKLHSAIAAMLAAAPGKEVGHE